MTITDAGYSPDTVTIKHGASVQWTNEGPTTHSVTADSGAFSSGSINGPGTDAYGNPTAPSKYSRPFTVIGTFGYHCSFHGGMRGAVIVTQ